MVKKQMKMFMAVLLVLALSLSGIYSPAFAATGQGTLTVIGTDEVNPLVSETNITIGDNTTVYDALIQAVGAENVDNSKGYISKIEDLEAKDSNYWAVYVNGVYTLDGVETHKLYPGDKVSFIYTDWNKPGSDVSLNIIGPNNESLISYSDHIGIVGSPTALQLLQVSLGSDQVSYDETAFTKIKGIAADANGHWDFFVNDKLINGDANSYILQSTDKFVLKYVKSTPSSESPSDNITAVSGEQLQKAIGSSSQYLLNHDFDDWSAVALNKAGIAIPASYLENTTQYIVKKSGEFRDIKDYERYTLGILAAGGDPRNVAGYNLVQAIYNNDMTSQEINGVIFALIALDSGNFTLPETAIWTRDKLVNEILKNQDQEDGHWSLSAVDTQSDSDITAMALTALAPYKDRADVKPKIDKGIQYLAEKYQSTTFNSQNAAQVIIALSSLGYYKTSSQLFEKNNSSIMDYLISFQNNDGGFALNKGEESDQMATQQGLMALEAYEKGSLYQFQIGKATISSGQPAGTGMKLPNTATDSANLLLGGFVLILAGIVLVYLNRKRRV